MAQFDPCGILPEPSINQGVTKSADCRGCYYSLKHPRTRTPKRDGAPYWRQFTLLPVARLNRLLTGGLAKAWIDILSASQRTAWETLSSSASWTNYDGSAAVSNGFNLFMAVNRFRRYSAWTPSQPGAALFTPAERLSGYQVLFPQSNPPASWSQPPAPSILTLQVFDGWVAYMTLANPPDPFNLIMETVATLDSNRLCPFPARRFVAVHNDPSISDFESEVFVSYDYPNPAATPRPRPSIGLRYTNFTTGNFSEPTWI